MTWVGTSEGAYLGMVFFAIVALAIYCALPRFLERATGRASSFKPILVIALVLLVTANLLPSPLIEGRSTQFLTHFVGGGLFSGLFWLYLYKNLRFKLSWFWQLVSIYVLVSSLGVANELFEFFGNKVGFFNINPSDTWWDLLANTLGALTFWLAYKLWAGNRR